MPEARPRIGVIRWEDVPGEPIEQYWERVREAGGEPIDLAGPPADVGALDGLMEGWTWHPTATAKRPTRR